MTLHPIAILIALSCVIVVPVVGMLASASSRDYISAGRRITLPAFVATLVCTWYGGILGVGEFAYSSGIVTWLALGAFYYLFALVYALVLAKRVRGAESLSIPEQISLRHGKIAGRFAGVYALLMVSPAPYLLMATLLLSALTGTSFAVSLALSLLLTVGYVWRGGLKSVILTDVIQFVLMFAGFGTVFLWLVLQHGFLGFLQQELPATHMSIPGTLSWGQVLVWGFVAMWTLVDPGFHQRVAVARDTQTARRGILLSILCWFVFDALTTFTGLYARALLPNLANPADAYPALAGILPPVIQGVFYGSMLATVLSTLDSFCFLSGSTIARDLLGLRDRDRVRRVTRMGLLVASILAAVMIWWMRSIVELWLTIAQLGIPVLLPVLLHSFLSRDTYPGHLFGLFSMISGATVSLSWQVLGWLHAQGGWPVYPFGLDPLYAALPVSSLVLLFGVVIHYKQKRAEAS